MLKSRYVSIPLVCFLLKEVQGFSYLSEVGGEGPVEFGKKNIWIIKNGKI